MFKKYHCVLQNDEKDCGPACILTVAKQFGESLSLAKLKEISGTDMDGTNIKGMIKALEHLNFDVRAVEVKDRKIDNTVPVPLIAHIHTEEGLLHYIVIHKIKGKNIIAADPAEGIKKYTYEEFLRQWTGILLFIKPKKDFQKIREEATSLGRFFRILKKQKVLLWNMFIVSIILTGLGIASSFYFKFLIDYVLKDRLENTLTVLMIGMIISGIIRILLGTFRSYLILFLTQKIDISILMGYYNHLIRLPLKFFITRKTGEIISRFSDASTIRGAISEAVMVIMIDVVMSVSGGIILYFQNPFLFFISLIMLLLYLAIVFSFKEKIKTSNKEVLENNSQLTSTLLQSIEGIETIKSYNLEREVQVETESKFLRYLRSSFKKHIIQNYLNVLSGTVELSGDTLILWIAAYQVIKGKISLGELMVFNSLLGYFTDPMKNLINLQPMVQSAIVSADRIGEIIDLELEQQGKKVEVYDLKGDIKIRNLEFRYGMRELILKDINMEIKKGEKIALVGESGSGKTTLVKLIMKFFNLEKGDILINDFNIKDVDNNSLRERISYISQDIFFFNKTVRENLTINDNIEINEIIKMSKKVNAYDFINNLPQRFEHMIEENGANLSTGQKQRLSILRALLKKPDILIMDEATSNLDSITESIIQETLMNLDFEMTVIIIAHRLSTIQLCDKIFVLEDGRIIESGSHKELISNKRKYYRLWKEQGSVYES